MGGEPQARATLFMAWMGSDDCPHCGCSIQGNRLATHVRLLSDDVVRELSIPYYMSGKGGGIVALSLWNLAYMLEPHLGSSKLMEGVGVGAPEDVAT